VVSSAKEARALVNVGARFSASSPRNEHLQTFGRAERADYGGDITLIGVDFGVEVAHFFGGDFTGQVG